METLITPYYEFFKLEKEMKLFALQHRGVNYWQLARFGLLKKITINKTRVINVSKSSRVIKKEILGAFRDSKRMNQSARQIEKADLIKIRPEIRFSDKGELDDYQYDFIKFDEAIKTIDLYALGDYIDVPQCAEYTMSPAEYKVVAWKIKRSIFGENSIDKEQKNVLNIFLDKINVIYNTKFEIKNLERDIQYLIASHIRYKKYYEELFEKISPKAIMVYPHYDEHMFSAIAAARKCGIKSIEMQHGRINAHEAYWYEDQSTEGKLLPDYFFSYGKWWIAQTNLPEFCRTVSVGNAYLQTQIETYAQENSSSHIIIVFSNPQNGKDLSELIYQVSDEIESMGMKVIYKLHPNEVKLWKTEYPCLNKMRNITVIENRVSIYELLSKAEFAIGVNSTVFFEATAYKGIKLIIYKSGDYFAMKPLLDSGIAKGVMNAEELKKVLVNWKIAENFDTTNFDLWENNAKYKIVSELEKVIKS